MKTYHKYNCDCGNCYNWRLLQASKPIKHTKKKKVIIDYFEYMQSPLWENRKARYYKRYQKVCRACGSRNSIQLHHLKYGNFGTEKDTDLMPLCVVCHHELHEVFDTSTNMHLETSQYIAAKQKKIKETKKLLTA